MANWKNPETRKIDGHTYRLVGEGLTKSEATKRAKQIRLMYGFARVIEDERLGRYDIRNHDVFYCVYSRRA